MYIFQCKVLSSHPPLHVRCRGDGDDSKLILCCSLLDISRNGSLKVESLKFESVFVLSTKELSSIWFYDSFHQNLNNLDTNFVYFNGNVIFANAIIFSPPSRAASLVPRTCSRTEQCEQLWKSDSNQLDISTDDWYHSSCQYMYIKTLQIL